MRAVAGGQEVTHEEASRRGGHACPLHMLTPYCNSPPTAAFSSTGWSSLDPQHTHSCCCAAPTAASSNAAPTQGGILCTAHTRTHSTHTAAVVLLQRLPLATLHPHKVISCVQRTHSCCRQRSLHAPAGHDPSGRVPIQHPSLPTPNPCTACPHAPPPCYCPVPTHPARPPPNPRGSMPPSLFMRPAPRQPTHHQPAHLTTWLCMLPSLPCAPHPVDQPTTNQPT